MFRLPLPAAVRVDVGVRQDPVEPGLEIRSLLELVERRKRLEVGLLDQVLRVLRVARHAQRAAIELVEQYVA